MTSSIQKIVILIAILFMAGLVFLGKTARDTINEHPVVQSKNSGQPQHSGSSEDLAETKKRLIAALEDKFPRMEIDDIEPSPLAGFYQVFFADQLLYLSEDGEYLFTGNLLELADDRPINHSEQAMARLEAKKAPMRKETIDSLNESDMVVFKAPEEKYVINVFTDVDCGYCRKLHKQVPELNKNGVTVRYLAFPRAGIGSSAHKKLVSIWCAEDRMAAMDDAKLRRKFGSNTCDNPIEDQYRLTREFNLSGTPAVLFSDGELVVSYIETNDLLNHLAYKASAKAEAASAE